jgi:hypothetical protein
MKNLKNIMSFEDFINESYNIDSNDKENKNLIECLKDLYADHLDELEYGDEDYNTMYEFFEEVENSGFDFSDLFEDEAGDIDKAYDTQMATKGRKGVVNFVGLLGWIYFTPFKAAYELIKLVQKKNELKAMIADVPEGPKKEALRTKLNSLRRDEIRDIAAIKQAQAMKKSANSNESNEIKFENFLNLVEGKGKITAKEKEKIINQAKSQGEAKGKQIASKSEELKDKMKDADPKKKKEVIAKLKSQAEENKKEWEKVKKKAEEAGVSL